MDRESEAEKPNHEMRQRIERVRERVKSEGRKARDRKSTLKMNPYSADTQPMQHSTWNDGWMEWNEEIANSRVDHAD